MLIRLLYTDATSTLQEVKLPGAESAPNIGEDIVVVVNDTQGECKLIGMELHLRVEARSHAFTLDHTPYGSSVDTVVLCTCSLQP